MLELKNVKKRIVKISLPYWGNKRRLLNNILDIFPKDIRNFYDVFTGSSVVSFNIEADKILANDKNDDLINLHKFLQKDLSLIEEKIEEVLEEYKLYGEDFKEEFLRLRKDFNKERKEEFFLFLLFFGINNLVRYNQKGELNTPFGRKVDKDYIINKIKEIKKNNKNILYYSKDYIDFVKIEELDKRDFIYFDPPYFIAPAGYNRKSIKGGWDLEEEEKLFELLLKLNSKNIRWALSNVFENKGVSNDYLKDFVKKNNFKIHFLDIKYNAKIGYKKEEKEEITKEVLITNF